MSDVTPSERASPNGNGNARSQTPHTPASPGKNSVRADSATPPANEAQVQVKNAASARKIKKRRKVNHACVYCRRSHMTCDQERPCTRCIKRSIGHLCHDEPRETPKKTKGEDDSGTREAAIASPGHERPARSLTAPSKTGQTNADLELVPPSLPHSGTAEVPPDSRRATVPENQSTSFNDGNTSYLAYDDWAGQNQSHLQDMHTFHHGYMFSNSEVSNEYNLLNDFLTNSLVDESLLGEDNTLMFQDASLTNTMGPLTGPGAPVTVQTPPNHISAPAKKSENPTIARPAAPNMSQSAREQYYLTAADPAGTDTPEERMRKLLQAKYDAGMLKPFNYIKGYAKLSTWMDANLHPNSKRVILKQMEKFRPLFRERIQTLQDIELVKVEMWFERKLMEYDRVFASMAIPACCWRRTGEIFRGNRGMAELIDVPVEQLRDGKLGIHEIIAEPSFVTYWEKFVEIAFDASQKAILTSCSLKSQNPKSKDTVLSCCFSFTIQRDEFQVPGLIIGNFLPI